MQLFVYFMANPNDFPTHEQRIHFALSYMKGGIAQMWAESCLEEIMTDHDEEITDSWNVFLARLEVDFSNPNAERAAQSELEMLWPDRRTAEDFFHFGQTAHRVGYKDGHKGYLISLLEQNMSAPLVNKVYQTTPLP
jgi:hypothetical protein